MLSRREAPPRAHRSADRHITIFQPLQTDKGWGPESTLANIRLVLHLKRKSYAVAGRQRRNGTVVGRLLLDLIRNAGEEGVPHSRTECYVRLAVHDLVGALFAPSDPAPVGHSDKLFMRVRGVIKDGFVDPDFDPSEVATRAGISLRYLQKLFTERGSTCSA